MLFRIMSGLTLLALSLVPSGRADTIGLGSYGTTSAAPAGVRNTATTTGSGGATYNLTGTNRTWASPLPNSFWVSFDANSSPGGADAPANGTYTYQTTFIVAGGNLFSGTLSVLADDTASVTLNGFTLTALNGTRPGLSTVATYLLPQVYLLAGENTLAFDVQQLHGGATGVDYSGSIAVAPESSSLVFLSIGLLGAATIIGLKSARSKVSVS